MNRGKWAGSWAGSGQARPFSSKPYTRREVEGLEEEYLAALQEHGAGHPTTEAHRQSVERAIASYNATHEFDAQGHKMATPRCEKCGVGAPPGFVLDGSQEGQPPVAHRVEARLVSYTSVGAEPARPLPRPLPSTPTKPSAGAVVRPGAMPSRERQEAREGPSAPAVPIGTSDAGDQAPVKVAPAQGVGMKRPRRPYHRWPHEEIARDVATLGQKEAQAKWIGQGMKREAWYVLLGRLRRQGLLPERQKREPRAKAPPTARAPQRVRKAASKITLRAYRAAALEALAEVKRARFELGHGPMPSAHEGYAVILEELDELWEYVRGHRSPENLAAMRGEAIQVAAMGIAFMVEVCDAPNP